MKNLVKTSLVVLFFATLSLGFSSCGGDTCYVCTGTTEDGVVTLEDLGEVCENDDDGAGGMVTSEDLEAAVLLYEALGGTCEKQ